MQIQRTAAILLSQQPMRPCGRDEWVRGTRNAVMWVKANSMILRSSAGMQTWDLITALASHEKLPMELLIPASSEDDYYRIRRDTVEQFGLDVSVTTFRPLIPDPDEEYDKAKFMRERDRLIGLNSDVIIPISIRKDGVMAGIIQNAEQSGKPIINSWRVKYRRREESLGYTINEGELTDQALSFDEDYIIHWTRAANGPWPTERATDYYRDIIRSQSFPRSGFDTLINIVRRKKIIASTGHMPDNKPCVCFSALTPRQLLPLIRWRQRYRRMSFEPYGIGIKRNTALQVGVKPVIYYENSEGRPSGVEPWRTQSSGVKSDWRQEKEYRHLNDLDLAEIAKEELICFCRTGEEANNLQNAFGIRTVGLTD